MLDNPLTNQELKNISLLRELIDKRCIVFSAENQFLFLGKLCAYEQHQDQGSQLVLKRYDEDAMESYLVAYTGFKLHIPLDNGEFGVVEIRISQWRRDYLVVDVVTAEKKTENRVYFRQNVGKGMTVESVNGQKVDHWCTVENISATGVAIICCQKYEIGDVLEFSRQRFRTSGPEHQLKFRVVRMVEIQEKCFLYGCQWIDMSSRAEEKLFQDIFALQAAELQKNGANRSKSL